MKHVLQIVILFGATAFAHGQTAILWDHGIAEDIAATHSEFIPYRSPVAIANEIDRADLRRWAEVSPRRYAPGTLVDLATFQSVPVTLATLASAKSNLATLVDAALNDAPKETDDGTATWRELRGTNSALRLEYADHRDTLTNRLAVAQARLASTAWGNTTQVARVVGDLQNEIEALYRLVGDLRKMNRLGWQVDQFHRTAAQ